MSSLRLPSYRTLYQYRYHPYPRFEGPASRGRVDEFYMEVWADALSDLHQYTHNPSAGAQQPQPGYSTPLKHVLLYDPQEMILVVNLGLVVSGMTGVVDEDWESYRWEDMVLAFALAMRRRRRPLE